MLAEKDKSILERHRRTLAQWDQYWWFVAIMYALFSISVITFVGWLVISLVNFQSDPNDPISQQFAMLSMGLANGLVLGILMSLAIIFIPVRMHYIRKTLRIHDALSETPDSPQS
jgi:hypothetical protein